MKLELGCEVRCTDGPFGELADVVIDPIAKRVTHIVVQPRHHAARARLVPVGQAKDDGDAIALDCAVADIEALEPMHESAYLRVGEFPVADPDWDIGVQDVLALPLYQETDGYSSVVDPDPHVMITYDRIPKNTVEIRRSSAVTSSDGHHVGHVDGLLISVDGAADIVLERGHLWGKREVVIPSDSIATVEDDAVALTITKDEVGALETRRVHRWF
jgi:sporulation protein YlmC with PRC-barrel domain